jgi:DNA-directed RNA polymerase subunit RPC12/RpoP
MRAMAHKKRSRRSEDAPLEQTPPPAPAQRPPAKIVVITPEHMLEHATRRFLAERTPECAKCGSTFIDHEPAFVHCRYCGAMARIANRSLLAQEEFELRSGLRVAS